MFWRNCRPRRLLRFQSQHLLPHRSLLWSIAPQNLSPLPILNHLNHCNSIRQFKLGLKLHQLQNHRLQNHPLQNQGRSKLRQPQRLQRNLS
jgi:hypothetical protein